MNEEIKTCPFCGGEGKVMVKIENESMLFAWCQCTSCGATVDGYYMPLNPAGYSFNDVLEWMRCVIETWNRRVEE